MSGTPITKESVAEQLLKARITLLLQQPFWGTLATRLILKDVTDDHEPGEESWCNTAATDGRYMYYNRNFIGKLNKQETIFLIAHEVEHVVYDHMSRRGGRNPKRWNAAADYVINQELVDNGIGKFPDPKTSGVQGCLDSKYKDMFAEEVYEQLVDDGNYPEFDVHIEPGDGKGEPMTDEERRCLSDEIKTAVMQAAKAAEAVRAGSTPAGVKRMLKDLTDPQMDWREIINMKFKSTIKDDYSWSRGNRKTQAMGIHLPGLKEGERIEAAVSIDCSGSMSEEMLKDLLTEVKGIMETFPDFKLHVWCFDTKCYNHQVFTPENLSDIDSYEIHGGGGTDFECNWNYMRQIELVPEEYICFTDGMDGGHPLWGTPDYCPTTFIIHSDPGQRYVSTHGTTVWYTK